MNKKCRVVVMIGGNGTNLQAMIDNPELPALIDIVGVISHRPQAYGLIRAKNAHIPTMIVDHSHYPDLESFGNALTAALRHYDPQLILLAGFMRILPAQVVNHYPGKILNIHPALLPKYKGLHTHQRVLAAGDVEHGATVHFVTQELDNGPIVAQVKIPIDPKETPSKLAERVQIIEHWLYPQVIKWFAEDRLKCEQNIVTLDGKSLAQTQLSLPVTQGIVS